MEKIINYDLNRPWLTLDPWQKEYIETPPNQDCFLLIGRQAGKTTAMSIKAVKLCIRHFKKGEFVLINSITEKQAYHMLAKALAYAEEKYPQFIDKSKDNKPTKHRIIFKNGTGILCYAAGETGEGLRGFTIKKLMPDEGSRMSEEYFIAVLPMLSVIDGSIDIASTPAGKKHKDGTEKYFYKCSLDKNFKKFYGSAEDCPRHDKEFLANQKKNLSRLAYAQEYLAVFTDELRRIFSDDEIKEICILKRRKMIIHGRNYYLGSDIGGFGESISTFEIFDRISRENIEQVENEISLKKLTTENSRKIINYENQYCLREIGVDDGGIGFGVFSELMSAEETRRKTKALNNASRPLNRDGTKSKKLLKEEMYINFKVLIENKKVKLLDDDEIKASLSSIQCDENGKIWGGDAHITEGMIRALWLCSQDKRNDLWIR